MDFTNEEMEKVREISEAFSSKRKVKEFSATLSVNDNGVAELITPTLNGDLRMIMVEPGETILSMARILIQTESNITLIKDSQVELLRIYFPKALCSDSESGEQLSINGIYTDIPLNDKLRIRFDGVQTVKAERDYAPQVIGDNGEIVDSPEEEPQPLPTVKVVIRYV